MTDEQILEVAERYSLPWRTEPDRFVGFARALLAAPGAPAPINIHKAIALIEKLDGYLNSPEQVELADELRDALALAPATVTVPSLAAAISMTGKPIASAPAPVAVTPEMLDEFEYAVLARCQGHGSAERIKTARDAILAAPAAVNARLHAALVEARRWIGDGDLGDGMNRSIWTTRYTAAVDMVDAALAAPGAPAPATRDKLRPNEPGAYFCRCCRCGEQFTGRKRDNVCALCEGAPAPVAPTEPQCPGRPDSRCNYLAACGHVCNKCGNVHDGIATSFLPAPVAVTPEHDARDAALSNAYADGRQDERADWLSRVLPLLRELEKSGTISEQQSAACYGSDLLTWRFARDELTPENFDHSMRPARCIKPQCPTTCDGCNHALSGYDEVGILIADLLDTFAVDDRDTPFEDGDSKLVDRARAYLRDTCSSWRRAAILAAPGAPAPAALPDGASGAAPVQPESAPPSYAARGYKTDSSCSWSAIGVCANCNRRHDGLPHLPEQTHDYARAPTAWLYTSVQDGVKALAFQPRQGDPGKWEPLFAGAARSKATSEQMMAGYEVACRFGIYESRAFDLAEKMFRAFFAGAAAAPQPQPEPDAPARMKLLTAINALEMLDKRPRPVCRDCADEDGTCPGSGLPCDMHSLIRECRAALAATPSQPAVEVTADPLRHALERVIAATHSHVDGRDLLAELHPRRMLDIKRRRDGVETWFEGDWLSNLWDAIKGARRVLDGQPFDLPRATAMSSSDGVACEFVAEPSTSSASASDATTVNGEATSARGTAGCTEPSSSLAGTLISSGGENAPGDKGGTPA